MVVCTVKERRTKKIVSTFVENLIINFRINIYLNFKWLLRPYGKRILCNCHVFLALDLENFAKDLFKSHKKSFTSVLYGSTSFVFNTYLFYKKCTFHV